MNPSEGGLRPQLLDRFGLMVDVVTEQDEAKRSQILQNVLFYEAARFGKKASQFVKSKREEDVAKSQQLINARQRFETKIQEMSHVIGLTNICAKVAQSFDTEGHRADYIMTLAAIAHATLMDKTFANGEDVLRVARFALQHRQRGGTLTWNEERERKVKEKINLAPT
jgi:magnesium chelatase subunit I